MWTKAGKAILWVSILAALWAGFAALREWQLLGAELRSVVANMAGSAK